MSKDKLFVGIDISKASFDVYDHLNGHRQYANDGKGFKQLIKSLPDVSYCVMEATGCYHQLLAKFLYDNGISVSVVNPLIIKRFMQMKLNQNKTDKSDSKMICQYGYEQTLKLWSPAPAYLEESKQIYGAIRIYLKQSTALKNRLHSLNDVGVSTGVLYRSIKRQIKNLQQEIAHLELELEAIIKNNDNGLLRRIMTIPGVGKKTAMLLIISTNGFISFESHKQLSSYFGLSPMERSSGTSIRGRSRISKSGDSKIRSHLFLCSFTASQCNPTCKALYERIVSKGKSKKLALIAVANKLIKQAYGIAKSGLEYDPNYRSRLIMV